MDYAHQPGAATTYAPLNQQYGGPAGVVDQHSVSGADYSPLTPANGNTADGNKVNVLLGYNPKKYSGKLLRKFYEECVLSYISNTDYEGEIRDYGDTVIIRTIPDIQIRDWKKGDVLQYDTYETGVVELKIDHAKTWSFVTDVLDQKQTDIKNFVESWTTDAAKRIAIAIEKSVYRYIFHTEAYSATEGTPTADVVAAANRGASAGAVSGSYNLGTTASPVVVTPANVIRKINDCGSVMAEQNLPVVNGQDFWMVIDQKFANTLASSELRLAYAMGDGKSIELRGGQMKIPHLDIFDIFRSNILPTAAVTHDQSTGAESAASYKYVLFGHKTALTFAAQLTKNEVLPSPDQFGMLHRGLTVYGFKVIYPKNIGCMVVTYGEDAPQAVSVSGDVAVVNSTTTNKTKLMTTIDGDVAIVNSATAGKEKIATDPT